MVTLLSKKQRNNCFPHYEMEKDMVFILTRKEDRNNIMKTIMGRAGMQTEARSLVFSLPVSDLAGLRKLDEE